MMAKAMDSDWASLPCALVLPPTSTKESISASDLEDQQTSLHKATTEFDHGGHQKAPCSLAANRLLNVLQATPNQAVPGT